MDLASGGKYKLTDVMISSDTKSGGDRPVETISFTYQKIEMTPLSSSKTHCRKPRGGPSKR